MYYIQPSSTGSFKILRMVSGSIGLASRNTIARSLTGDPATDGLFWIDDNGVYFHSGDNQPPKNLMLGTHEEYWRQISTSDKASAVGFYNSLKREYWLQVGDKLLAYELSYNKWKKHSFTFVSGISEFYGIFNNILYYRKDNTLAKFDVFSNNREAVLIETPYNTAFRLGSQVSNILSATAPEVFSKILQELYIVFADADAVSLYMQVYVDNMFLTSYTFSSDNNFDKMLAPLGVRFNKIKFRLFTLATDKKVRVKEFGYSYSEDSKEALATKVVASGLTVAGYGRAYGRSYGRN